MESTESDIFDGKAFCETLTSLCGVYRMIDANNKVIYVGKARNLKKRVSSYFTAINRHNPKVRAMVMQIQAIEITVTHTENEALILENNLIKELKPRYNINLRDDKSYPYIFLARDHDYPRLSFHRGTRNGKGDYFGPFPNAGAVRSSLNLLQKLFLIRPCTDSFFKNRTRPCLQYQIKRCSGPCVNKVDQASYQEDVEHAVMFLQGKSDVVVEHLIKKMEVAASTLEYEKAAYIRDQINQLKRVQQRQYISSDAGDIDIVVSAMQSEVVCVQVFFIRAGHNLGNKTFFPSNAMSNSEDELLQAFLAQYYLSYHQDRSIPNEILINHPLADTTVLAETIQQETGQKTRIHKPTRGDRARWVAMAMQNAELALKQRLTESENYTLRWQALQQALGATQEWQRIECFDISHTMGEATVASCVVFNHEGPLKTDYRRFNIEAVTAGDDYAAMRQALSRRYSRLKKEEAKLPDVIMVDGGPGQMEQAIDILTSLELEHLTLLAVAKGPSRKPGFEKLLLNFAKQSLVLTHDSPALHLIQYIRDEAHRFAITGHRRQRNTTRKASPLLEIGGIGAKRRKQLIQHFGGLQGVTRAGIEDLSQVPGISRQLAIKIYHFFHAGS